MCLSIFNNLHTRWSAKGLDDNLAVHLESKVGHQRSRQCVVTGCSGRTRAEALVCLRVEAPGAGPGRRDLEAAQHPGLLCGQREGGAQAYGPGEPGDRERGRTAATLNSTPSITDHHRW